MTTKRGNGEGSVYRRGDGRVVGEYEDANGKRRYVSGKTKAEVRRKLRRLLADRDEGIAYDSENLTVDGYLDRWLDAVKGSVRQRTWERHEQVVRLHLNLSGAYLRNTNLHEADLLRIDLSEANFQGAKLKRALLCGVDLRGAENLTQGQLDATEDGAQVMLPEGLVPPSEWEETDSMQGVSEATVHKVAVSK